MARVNVEQKALTDPRFRILGSGLFKGRRPPKEQLELAFGLYHAMRVWDYCQEHGVYVVPDTVLRAIHEALPEALMCAMLATPLENGWRIHGTEGRIEWLQKRRQDGKRGGRPITLGLDRKHPQDNPPAPAPAPALEQETTLVRSASPKRTRRSPLVPQDDPELLARFEKLYAYYPRHVGKEAAWKVFKRERYDLDTCKAIALNIKSRVDSGSWVPDDPERSRFIPHLASFLNQKRWQDEDVA